MPDVMSPTLASRTLAPETEARLRVYADLLGIWTRRINLVSRNDREHIWDRHVLDSLRLARFIPPGTARAIDLGSGGGLPGLVLSIATGIPFDLVESDRRKSAFLLEAARATEAPVTVHTTRIEAADLEPAPLVTARALARLPGLLALAAPLLAPGGLMLFPKGAHAEDELLEARAEWSFALARLNAGDHPILAIANPRRLGHVDDDASRAEPHAESDVDDD